MDRMRDELFSCSAFPVDQDVRMGGGDLLIRSNTVCMARLSPMTERSGGPACRHRIPVLRRPAATVSGPHYPRSCRERATGHLQKIALANGLVM